MQAGNDCSTNSLAQCPPTCHCEAPKGPWQSRRTRLDNRSLPAKTQPVAGDSHVASLLGMTNLGALHVHRECLHICNCQWRSLSAATDAIGAHHFIDTRYGLRVQRRERHAAPLRGRCGRRSATKPIACMALSERRYTPYFGVCHFNGGRYGTAVPSRDCTPRALPRAARSGRHGPFGASQ